MSNFQSCLEGVTMFSLVVILSRVRANSLQLGRVMKVFADESIVFNLRKHSFPIVLWVSIATVVKERTNIVFAHERVCRGSFSVSLSCRYPNRRRNRCDVATIILEINNEGWGCCSVMLMVIVEAVQTAGLS